MNKTSFIARVAAISGLAVGAFAFAAIAGTWTAPTATPPTGNVAAPINVGNGTPVINQSGIQEKTDSLILDNGLTVLGNLVIAGGSPTAGAVLTSNDATGAVKWGQTVSKITAGNNVTISPTSGVGNVTVNASKTGTVGGGCYVHGHSNVPVYNVMGWGNATGHDGQLVSASSCTCPTGYSSVTISGGSTDEAAFLCLAN